mmetsp:Transcript_48215/g.73400  ORF Transcript_48215/g.73400 Transcript_48215/m.73400 type:complete len:318 (+) Transcript_48215:191-1144(+)|eukprot:CAMPEP_0116999488 /NCGR_PEP_ID=MMETSP0472-20121206/2170_1 /TAXON_ID=693140 ORGANISM="Tiarina fusus, Strain LIS" /NCGR_SAMPLE_ID=MMETSP0472 /ASSEMBLY_ACC=CAM_ASM_000603 /LENGTH=317 /DNA_ID=CAMNT_0004698911 /DNA_START=175 /DNA_END=1128 /DNA_ORIENTATION=+
MPSPQQKKNGGGGDSAKIAAEPQPTPQGKTKIAERLQKAADEATAEKNKNRSPELIPLTEEYEAMKKKLRRLIAVVKSYAEKTGQMNAARDELVNHLAQMSRKSPLYDSIGSELDGEAKEALKAIGQSPDGKVTVDQTATAWKERNDTEICSLKVVQELASAQAKVDAHEYREHVIDYVEEWEKIVTARVESGLKEVRTLHADRNHYENKVEQLRQKEHDMEAKGKTFPASQAEKLERNETKLTHAFTVHESCASKLCVIIEAATRDGWKDLYHVVKNYIQWESNRVGQESEIYCQLSGALTAMKTSFDEETGKMKE